MDNKEILLPEALTAENGAKYLFTGEFFETIEIDNPEYCGCGECDQCMWEEGTPTETIILKVPVTWTTIKEIYKKVVEEYRPKNNG